MQTKLRNIMSSKKGFTLIELLVVIGILAVLAAIAIPSVAGLIDRANVSADKTNANEMTNALERFTSEYELYMQDVSSKTLNTSNLDSAQGRVKNVIGATTRDGITALELAQGTTKVTVGSEQKDIKALESAYLFRDTKYPANEYTFKKLVQNYTKTSSSTFEPKQSDCHFYYSPECGLVVCSVAGAKDTDLNKLVISGMDAKGNALTAASVTWIDLTTETLGDCAQDA